MHDFDREKAVIVAEINSNDPVVAEIGLLSDGLCRHAEGSRGTQDGHWFHRSVTAGRVRPVPLSASDWQGSLPRRQLPSKLLGGLTRPSVSIAAISVARAGGVSNDLTLIDPGIDVGIVDAGLSRDSCDEAPLPDPCTCPRRDGVPRPWPLRAVPVQ